MKRPVVAVCLSVVLCAHLFAAPAGSNRESGDWTWHERVVKKIVQVIQYIVQPLDELLPPRP